MITGSVASQVSVTEHDVLVVNRGGKKIVNRILGQGKTDGVTQSDRRCVRQLQR